MRQIIQLIEKLYDLTVIEVTPILVGVGGETYLVTCNQNNYIFKICEIDGMSHPKQEAVICRKLKEEGLPVPSYLESKSGEYSVAIQYGGKEHICHMQTYLEGTYYKEHTAPEWLMKESAQTLAKIHLCLSKVDELPIGIGAGFFEHMTKESAKAAYENSLQIAKDRKDNNIICDLRVRIEIIKHFPEMKIEPTKLTYCNTHGDYTINQLICNNDSITGVVDWTTACRHPVIWELVRSFLLAEPTSESGYIDKEKLVAYVMEYTSIYPLNAYDISHLLDVYYYQIAVCDYYGQYYHATQQNKEEYLHQAKFATNVMRYLDEHREEIGEYIINELS